MSEVGDIIHPFGRPERVIERVLIRHPETGAPLYTALRTEPVEPATTSTQPKETS